MKTSGEAEKYVTQSTFQWAIGLMVGSYLVGVGVLANELANVRSTIWDLSNTILEMNNTILELNKDMNQGFARLEINDTKQTADIQNIENVSKARHDLHLATDHKSTTE